MKGETILSRIRFGAQRCHHAIDTFLAVAQYELLKYKHHDKKGTLIRGRRRRNLLKLFLAREKSSDILSAHSLRMRGIHGHFSRSYTPVASIANACLTRLAQSFQG